MNKKETKMEVQEKKKKVKVKRTTRNISIILLLCSPNRAHSQRPSPGLPDNFLLFSAPVTAINNRTDRHKAYNQKTDKLRRPKV